VVPDDVVPTHDRGTSHRSRRGVAIVTEPRKHSDEPDHVVHDLVEYFIVAMPDLGSLATLAPALVQVVKSAAIRILDLVVVVKDSEGVVTALELEAVESMASLRGLTVEVGGMLTDHDIGLASFALRPGSAGVLLVTEDRWAEPLSAAAQRAGGQIVAGERIPAPRVESVLAKPSDDDTTGG
jgi:Family of unknown function (DUF6325)